MLTLDGRTGALKWRRDTKLRSAWQRQLESTTDIALQVGANQTKGMMVSMHQLEGSTGDAMLEEGDDPASLVNLGRNNRVGRLMVTDVDGSPSLKPLRLRSQKSHAA